MPKKWNTDANPAENLLTLFTILLCSNKDLSLSKLAEELNCSKQTVARYINQLESAKFGKTIRIKTGKEVAYRLEKPKNSPKLSLNAEGLHQLALCRDFMVHLLPTSMRKNMDTALYQAAAYLPVADTNETLLQIGEVYTKGRIDYSPFQAMLQTIIASIRQHKVCTIKHQTSIYESVKEYDFAPKQLIAFRETIYIHGWTVNDKGKAQPIYDNMTKLALHRLKEVVLTNRSSKHLPEIQEKHKDTFGVMEEKIFTVRIKFSPEAASYITERIWSIDQNINFQKTGYIILSITARSPVEIISWVLSFADRAEILSPKWLREELKRLLVNITGKYEGMKKMVPLNLNPLKE